jgi:hypothetical protein
MTAGPSPGAAFDVGVWISVLGLDQCETEAVVVARRQGASPYLMRTGWALAQLMAKTGALTGARDMHWLRALRRLRTSESPERSPGASTPV